MDEISEFKNIGIKDLMVIQASSENPCISSLGNLIGGQLNQSTISPLLEQTPSSSPPPFYWLSILQKNKLVKWKGKKVQNGSIGILG